MKEIQLTQAIIDGKKEDIDELMSDAFIREWINNQVPRGTLYDDGLDRSIEWTTPLCRACGLSTLDTVNELLREGAKVYNVNSRGDTALTRTCLGRSNDMLQLVELLVNHDEKLLTATDDSGFTPLHCASESGNVEVCEYLIKQVSNVKARTCKDSLTCLHVAASADHVGVMKCLMNQGASLGDRNGNDATPLHSASLNGAQNAVQFILDKKEDVNKRGFQDRTALHCAAQNGHINIVELLMDNDAIVDARDKNGITPIYLAALNGHQNIVRFLVKKCNVDVNIKTKKGRTPLHAASEAGHLKVAYALISQKSCKIDAEDDMGCTPLALAIENEHHDLVSYLNQEGHSRRALVRIESLEEEVVQIRRRESREDTLQRRFSNDLSLTDDNKLSAQNLYRAVQQEMEYLSKNIQPDYIDYMFSSEVIGLDEVQKLKSYPSDGEKVKELLYTLLKKQNNGWTQAFMKHLSEKSSFAAERVLETASKLSK